MGPAARQDLVAVFYFVWLIQLTLQGCRLLPSESVAAHSREVMDGAFACFSCRHERFCPCQRFYAPASHPPDVNFRTAADAFRVSGPTLVWVPIAWAQAKTPLLLVPDPSPLAQVPPDLQDSLMGTTWGESTFGLSGRLPEVPHPSLPCHSPGASNRSIRPLTVIGIAASDGCIGVCFDD